MALSAMIPRMLFTLHSIPRRQSAHVFVSSQRTRDSSPRLSAVLLSSSLLRVHPVAFCSRLPFSFSPVSTFGTRFLFILVLPLLAPFSLVLVFR